MQDFAIAGRKQKNQHQMYQEKSACLADLNTGKLTRERTHTCVAGTMQGDQYLLKKTHPEMLGLFLQTMLEMLLFKQFNQGVLQASCDALHSLMWCEQQKFAVLMTQVRWKSCGCQFLQVRACEEPRQLVHVFISVLVPWCLSVCRNFGENICKFVCSGEVLYLRVVKKGECVCAEVMICDHW